MSDNSIAKNTWQEDKDLTKIENANSLLLISNATIEKLNKQVMEADAELDRLRGIERTAQMDIAGLLAERLAWKTAHPNSPLLANTSKQFKDGESKNGLRLAFEAGFDIEGRKIGITNPADFRED